MRKVRFVRSLLVVAALMASTLALGGGAAEPAQAAGIDYGIVAGDQGSNSLIAYDPATWAVRWTWQPKTTEGFTSDEISAFGLVTDFKLRNTSAGQRMVVTASGGLAAIVTPYPEGKKVWSANLSGDNLHGAELLPNGNIVVASSEKLTTTTNGGRTGTGAGGFLRVYASSQGANNATYAEYPLNEAHGALWDPTYDRLWAIGYNGSGAPVLDSFTITGSAAQPHLTLDKQINLRDTLKDTAPHDLTADPNNANVLLLSTGTKTWSYDKWKGSFTPLVTANDVKAISAQPSGQLVMTQPDSSKTPETAGGCSTNTWCTDTIDFYSPVKNLDGSVSGYTHTSHKVTGARFYRARVWNPTYNSVGDATHGTVSDGALSGGLRTPAVIDANARISQISAAALPDGTLHVQTLLPGAGVWDRTRNLDGTWSTSTQIDANPAITAISAVALPDGTLHVQTLIPGAGVWDRTRSAAGTWSSSSQIDADGRTSRISAAALPDGTLHVQTLLPGWGVWDRTRTSSGSWSNRTQLVVDCAINDTSDPCITDVSATPGADGGLNVQVLRAGYGISAVSVRAWAGANWPLPTTDVDRNPSITRLAASITSDGTMHLEAIVPGYGIWDRTLAPNATSWAASATQIDSIGGDFAVYSVGLPDGSLHVGSAAY
ncbi:DUF6528 family protein [Streptomyces sp. NRRL WC-3742]|uniref:DUF6528 family protein n=1 Tax=Streptomyces sp. NRRL WC-3742 TaxID=1463934 RepID=UPI0004C6E046|nr:DUF6528 family protein [Streptomyces sp. NRRL WC-3742]